MSQMTVIRPSLLIAAHGAFLYQRISVCLRQGYFLTQAYGVEQCLAPLVWFSLVFMIYQPLLFIVRNEYSFNIILQYETKLQNLNK